MFIYSSLNFIGLVFATLFDAEQGCPRGGGMSLKILIVEDNPDWEVIWRLIIDVFAEAAEIVWATSVVEAERLVGQIETEGIKFDIIISDIFLSGSFTGFDFYNHLDPRYRERFLFVSSAQSDKVRAILSADNEKIRVLQKPFGIKQAVEELRGIIKKVGVRPMVRTEENSGTHFNQDLRGLNE